MNFAIIVPLLALLHMPCGVPARSDTSYHSFCGYHMPSSFLPPFFLTTNAQTISRTMTLKSKSTSSCLKYHLP